ncbi:hypothetical protein CMI37_13345 [Candidatus Pacearchaeota archaeon]|nr:hypothetical protein [Candidatus Pacearchaeota archaeon]|tara:strand:- start:1662 stop:2051 length:390 start_codon:yes stop_codon:yes gene_type:complete
MTEKICEATVTHNPTNNAFGRQGSRNCPHKAKGTRQSKWFDNKTSSWQLNKTEYLCGVHLRQYDLNEKRSQAGTARVNRMGAGEKLAEVLNSELEKGKESISFDQIVTTSQGEETLADLVVRAKSLFAG